MDLEKIRIGGLKMNLKNLMITHERLEHDMRRNREQQRELQRQQGQLEEFYALICKKISEKMMEA